MTTSTAMTPHMTRLSRGEAGVPAGPAETSGRTQNVRGRRGSATRNGRFAPSASWRVVSANHLRRRRFLPHHLRRRFLPRHLRHRFLPRHLRRRCHPRRLRLQARCRHGFHTPSAPPTPSASRSESTLDRTPHRSSARPPRVQRGATSLCIQAQHPTGAVVAAARQTRPKNTSCGTSIPLSIVTTLGLRASHRHRHRCPPRLSPRRRPLRRPLRHRCRPGRHRLSRRSAPLFPTWSFGTTSGRATPTGT